MTFWRGISSRLYNPSFYGVYAPAIGFGLGGGQVSYPTVCQFLNGGGVREFDTESRVPYAYHKRDWISYDDEQSLQEKVEQCSTTTRTTHFGRKACLNPNISASALWTLFF